MKFVHIADVHFDVPFSTISDRAELGQARRLEQREAFKKVIEFIKENNIEYSIHGVCGCTCGGLELRQDGKSYPTDKILEIINGSLKNHWIYFQENKNQPGFLTVHSKFDKKP